MAMRKQAENQGANILDVNFRSVSGKSPFEIITDDDKKYYSKSIIIATGADTKWLAVPGEKERIGRGVSSCAPCDAPFFRNKRVIVVGGGDSEMGEALVLTKFASEIFIIHRKDRFRASDVMQRRVFENPKITVIWNTKVTEIMGENRVESVRLATTTNNQLLNTKHNGKSLQIKIDEINGKQLEVTSQKLSWEFPIDGVFVAIGHIPNSEVFKGLPAGRQGIDLDEKGFIKVYDHTKTNIEGVFVAGDVHDAHYKQAVTAAGFGCMAAMEVEKWLELQPKQLS
jgi:thioredoxin reductase (NADPH)